MNQPSSAPSADIALLLEGTFPYVAGGVSSWVHQLIEFFPEYRFAIVFIGGRRRDYGKQIYKLPANVVHMEEHFLHDDTQAPPKCPHARTINDYSQLEQLHDAFRHGDCTRMRALMESALPHMHEAGRYGEAAFLDSPEAWRMITEQYERHCTDPSFTDYFWTVRLIHRPIWQLEAISRSMVSARVYHTISTGYAGFLGALARYRGRGRLLLSEHGIYTKERKIDLLQSVWLRDNRSLLERNPAEVGYLRELWIRFFQTLGRFCYEAADDITSLYDGNRLQQIRDGAPAEKIQVIPNGIKLPRFRPLREERTTAVPAVVALIGRVVPIKDIKTFIRAIYTARQSMPQLRGLVIGPEDEEPDYAQECRELVSRLGLEDGLDFLGRRKIDELLPSIGIIALSSISEGLPLVLLEGFAAGIPAVATDVGSCRMLIEGGSPQDRALGAAGSVVPIANPQRMSEAWINLFTHPEAWQAAQAAAIARAETYYDEMHMRAGFHSLYESLVHESLETTGQS